jgi:hypothetical protein
MVLTMVKEYLESIRWQEKVQEEHEYHHCQQKSISMTFSDSAKSDTFARIVSTSFCDRRDSWFFYQAIYLKSIVYAFPTCYFEETILKKVQNAALRAFLSKCGYNCNTKRVTVFAPHRYGGCGFTPLYLIQGEGKIFLFLKYWRTYTPAGRLLCIATSWTQLHIGTSRFFLQDTTTHIPHLQGQWLWSLRTFLSRIDASIEVDNPYLPPLQRKHDTFIMDQILQSGSFKPAEIITINYCCMHLQAITVPALTSLL